jgi:hypothetical protein
MIVVMGRELGHDWSRKDSSAGRGAEMTRAAMIARACPGFAPRAVVDQLPVVRSRMVDLPYRQCKVVKTSLLLCAVQQNFLRTVPYVHTVRSRASNALVVVRSPGVAIEPKGTGCLNGIFASRLVPAIKNRVKSGTQNLYASLRDLGGEGDHRLDLSMSGWSAREKG